MNTISNSIKRTYNIKNKNLQILIDSLQPIELPKRTILISPEKVDRNVYFIEKGIARSYNLIDGKEVTAWFSKEGELIYSTNSFYGKREGYESEVIQVLENSLFYYMPIVELENLCTTNIEIANWLRLLHQNAFVEMERRLITQLYLSAEERYNIFFMKNQDLFQRINLSYIASYLGMSHVTLCA